ncbi:MAG TPA: hypothetical protein VNT54_19365 [Solirubrobacteraceae bacterium]|nr:hypothetical protein [Solirubrobacteraceae bacterium]
MLVGLGSNTVITGAFSGGGDGACPMLAAHRAGGRTSACSFPEAWDRFTGVAGRHIVRPATEYEVQILRREIEASLEPGPTGMFVDVIAEHQAAVQARHREEVAVEARHREEVAAAQQPEQPAEPRRRRIRITGGERIDLAGAIEEHRETARQRRRREAEATGLNWLFEETLVLPEDFEDEPVAGESSRQEFDFEAAESDLLKH